MSSLSSDNRKTQSSPYINRFLQPDTIVPDLSNPQGWNRFSYVTNRPVNFNDPTGHSMDDGCKDYGCDFGTSSSTFSNSSYTPESTGGDPDVELGSGGVCIQCHTGASPQIPQNPYSDWYSGKYSGCFMCHSAVANGQTILTNSQLYASYTNSSIAQGYGGIIIIGSIVAGGIIGYTLPAATSGGMACAANSNCLTSVDDMFEGASNIADDAYVAIHPAAANASIIENGLNPAKAGSEYVYLTQMRYIRGIDLVSVADNLAVDATKWTSQPVSLWEVSSTAQNLQSYFGPGLGNVPQWVSSSPLLQLVLHSQIP